MADDGKHAFVGDGVVCGKEGCTDAKTAASHFAEGDAKHAFVGDGEKCGKEGCPDAKGAASHFTELHKALGFKAGETPSESEMIAVVTGIKTENVAKFGEGDAELRKEVVSLRHDNLVSRYSEEAAKLTLVEGTPAEITAKFVEFHEKFGEAETKTLLDGYRAVQAAAESTGVMGNILIDKAPAASDFMEAVEKHAAENPSKTKSESMDFVQTNSPALYTEYQNERTSRNGFGKNAPSRV